MNSKLAYSIPNIIKEVKIKDLMSFFYQEVAYKISYVDCDAPITLVKQRES